MQYVLTIIIKLVLHDMMLLPNNMNMFMLVALTTRIPNGIFGMLLLLRIIMHHVTPTPYADKKRTTC